MNKDSVKKMFYPLLSKVSRPPLDPSIHTRLRLFDDLSDHYNKTLVVLCAPPGFGKTTLMNDWSRTEDMPTAWYTIDVQDNHPQLFVKYVIEALKHALIPLDSTILEDMDENLDIELALTILLNHLPRQSDESFLLVLDDYHKITHPDIHRGIQFFLDHMPRYVTMAILTRTKPPIGLAKIRAHRKLLEIDLSKLCFTTDEVKALLSKQLPFEVSSEQIERLQYAVEGWAAGIQLMLISASSSKMVNEFCDQLLQGHRYVEDYFYEEVFQSLDSSMKEFLLICAQLNDFDEKLLKSFFNNPLNNDQLTLLDKKTSDKKFNLSRHFLDQVEKSFLFLVSSQGNKDHYRFQRLFSVFLDNQLSSQEPQKLKIIHQKASDVCLQSSYIDKALNHSLKAEDYDRLISILLHHGCHLFLEGRLQLLIEGFKFLDDSLVNDYPLLILLKCWVGQNTYHFDDIEGWLKQAESGLEEKVTEEELYALKCEFSAIRAQVAMNQGLLDQANHHATKALTHEPVFMKSSKIMAESVIGEACFVKGQLKEARQRIQKVERLARSQSVTNLVLWTLSLQSEISMAEGYLQKAWNLQEKAFHYIDQKQVQYHPIFEFVHRVRGQILWEWHSLDGAEQAALNGIEVFQDTEERWNLQCYCLLAKVAHGRSKQDICTEYVNRIQQLLASNDYHIDWQANAHATLLTYWDAMKHVESVQQWMLLAPPIKNTSNHFQQCNARNHVHAYIVLKDYDAALAILNDIQEQAVQLGLVLDQNRNHIFYSWVYWLLDDKEKAVAHLTDALELAGTTGVVSSFLRVGKLIIPILKAVIQSQKLEFMEQQRAERLIQLSHERRDFSRSIRISLDESVIRDIIHRPDVPELIRTSPLTKREWQVLSLIHAGLSNEQIAAHLNVAYTTIKTHIRSLYQKLNISNRQHAIELARDLLEKIQGK